MPAEQTASAGPGFKFYFWPAHLREIIGWQRLRKPAVQFLCEAGLSMNINLDRKKLFYE